jgi:hypothetical protein
MPAPLDVLTAGALKRALGVIPLTQADLAKSAKLAQGTVSNFLRARPVRIEHAESILEAIAAASHQASLSEVNAARVADTLQRARASLNAESVGRYGFRDGLKSLWAPSDYLMIVMALTDDQRMNLSKSFDYLNAEHFRAHVRCVAAGVRYKWVVYETESPGKIRSEYRQYIEELQLQLAQDHSAELQRALKKKRPAEKDVRRFLEERVQCRVVPHGAQRPAQQIPFRITIFGDIVCLCSEERELRGYQYSEEYFVLSASELVGVKQALEGLFIVCPDIRGQAAATPDAREKCRASHDRVRQEFLKALVYKIGT